MMKPLGHKAYGSIAHLPDSRMGPADHHCHSGQATICTTKTRDKHDRIIVLEKLDGANCCIANIDGEIIPLIRSGYRAQDARYEHLKLFANWVWSHPGRFDFLEPGSRLVGEWMALAHGTVYSRLPADPFVPFDVIDGQKRRPFEAVQSAAYLAGLTHAPILHDGGPLTVERALKLMGAEGAFGAAGGPEGVVYRVERKCDVDFLAKYVRPDKVDGAYLSDVSGHPDIWHWPPERRSAA